MHDVDVADGLEVLLDVLPVAEHVTALNLDSAFPKAIDSLALEG